MRLKSELLDQLIWDPFNKKEVMGRFIDAELIPHFYKKYPDLFEEEIDTKKVENSKEKKKIDALHITNSVQYGSNDNNGSE